MLRSAVRRICDHAYLLAVCAFLLWDIAYMTEAAWTFAAPVYLRRAACVLALYPLTRRKRGAFLIPWLFLAWMTGISAYMGEHILATQRPAIENGVIALLVLLPAASAAEPRRLWGWVRAVLALWTAAMTAQALVGLWAMLSGHAVFSLRGTWYIGLNRGDHRLYLNAYVTTGAVKMGLSVLLAVLGAALSKRRVVRVLYALSAGIMLLCLALTDCRTAFIAVGACLGEMLAVSLLHWKPRKHRPRPFLRLGAAALALLLVMIGVYGGLSAFVSAVGPRVPYELDNLTLLELPEHLLPQAAAEEQAGVQHRDIEADDVFNGRSAIWKAAVTFLREQPHWLLTGTTAVQAPVLTNLYLDISAGKTFSHVHNIYLHVLVAWGVPGAAMVLLFLLIFLRAAWRVTMRHVLPEWMRLIPVPALYVLICEMVDCFTLFAAGSPMLYFACFFAGWTITLDRRAGAGEVQL